jgi:glycosyltransferase involved in cell wall biosynthesis
MFSVLISVYKSDSDRFFFDALDSILKQTFLPAQVVLVCDGPLNNSLEEVVEEFKTKFSVNNILFKVARLKVNVGLGGALAHGVKYCTENFIVRMDSDDLSLENRLELTKNFIDSNPGFSVYGGQIEEFNVIVGDLGRLREVPLTHSSILKYAKLRNPMNHVTVCINRQVLGEVGSYESVLYHEDYYLWVKYISLGKRLVNLPNVLVHVRVGNDLIGRRAGSKYLQYEIEFVSKCIEIGFFNRLNGFIYLFPRCILRFLPHRVLAYVYKKIRK